MFNFFLGEGKNESFVFRTKNLYKRLAKTQLRTAILILFLFSIHGGIMHLISSPQVNYAFFRHTVPAPGSLMFSDSMILVKGGTFEMGDVMGDKENKEETVHQVSLRDFMLAKYETTVDQYDMYCNSIGREISGYAQMGKGKHPIIHVSWYEAIEYCNWCSTQDSLPPYYHVDKINQDPNNQNYEVKWLVTKNEKSNGYRLPTESEWEYAARSRGKMVRFGNDKNIASPKEINFDASMAYKKAYSLTGEFLGQTLPVGSFEPNSLGFYDLSGNIFEWCWDWKGSYPAGTTINPQGAAKGSFRVCRGGSCVYGPDGSRTAFRGYGAPGARYHMGFRLAKNIPEE